MPIGEPKIPTQEGDQEDMEAIFTKLKELGEKDLTEKDVEWFKSGVVEEAFRSRDASLYPDGEVPDTIDTTGQEEFGRSDVLESLRGSVKEKVESWEKNNLE